MMLRVPGIRIAVPLVVAICAFSAVASARFLCVPKVWRNGDTLPVCSEDEMVCAEWNVPGDACMGFHRAPACFDRPTAYCFADESPGQAAELACFATRVACATARQHASQIERHAVSVCAHAQGHVPYRLLNRTVAPR